MNRKLDVIEDVPHIMNMTRSELESVVTLLDQRANFDLDIVPALRNWAPKIADRLESLSGTDVDDYLRILKGATGHILATPNLPEHPTIEQVQRVVDNIEE
jgi:hypothetical protein